MNRKGLEEKRNDLKSQMNELLETSKKEESMVCVAMKMVIDTIHTQFPNVKLTYKKRLYLSEIIKKIKSIDPTEHFTVVMPTSFITPDAGFLYATINNEDKPILIGEVKNQGTNDKRLEEGKKKQSKGNAIERLGKNVLAIKRFLTGYECNPFICFGDGCDFSDDSSIVDRVKTISGFKPLNTINIKNGCFDNGSFFFREKKWTLPEMYDIMLTVALNTLKTYLGEQNG